MVGDISRDELEIMCVGELERWGFEVWGSF